jgi:DNA replication initiation complex subunit (GINS family)
VSSFILRFRGVNILSNFLSIVSDEKGIEQEEIGKIKFLEEQTRTKWGELVELPQDFYIKTKKLIEDLRKKGDLEKAKKLEESLDTIINIRTRKILMLAYFKVNDDKLINKMTFEEKELFQLLREVIDEWQQKVK